MKWILSLILFGLTYLSIGQIVITDDPTVGANPTRFVVLDSKTISISKGIINSSRNTDLKLAELVLVSTRNPTSGVETIRTSNPMEIKKLTINGNNIGVIGEITVTDEIVFTKGNILVDKTGASLGTLTYAGSKQLVGSASSYINGRMFTLGTGERLFPIGNAKGYFPARLDGISAADAAIQLGLEVTTDPGFVKTPDLKEIFTDHVWEFSTSGTGVFSGNTQISLSDNTGGFFGTDGDATILELSNSGVQTDLFGSPNNGFYTSSSPMSASGKYYGLAKADQITVRIRKLITPNDDQENDVLVVDGLDAFPDNQITLIDRWGVVVKTWKGFVNYKEPAGVEQSDFNFAKLAIGNYVCVVEYTERGTRKSKKQMIAVLK